LTYYEVLIFVKIIFNLNSNNYIFGLPRRDYFITLFTSELNHKAISIRPFIGAWNFEISRNFYRDLGFQETVLYPTMSLFKSGDLSFYLQDAYVKDWVDNTMIFMEVQNVDQFLEELFRLKLETKYQGVRISPVREYDWGRECFLHDPSGILWHFGEFTK
jgi:hypothetical protein